jgi:hypothetical protein
MTRVVAVTVLFAGFTSNSPVAVAVHVIVVGEFTLNRGPIRHLRRHNVYGFRGRPRL